MPPNLSYARHFTVLICAGASLVLLSRWRALPPALPAFALYGAVHASALAVSQPVSQPLWRRLLFVAAAALLSVLTVRLGLALMQLSQRVPAAAPAVIALAAFGGAMLYGALIRRCGIQDVQWRTLTAAALSCALVTLAAFNVARRIGGSSSLWLAIPWWLAFSGNLWYVDRNARRQPMEGRAQDSG